SWRSPSTSATRAKRRSRARSSAWSGLRRAPGDGRNGRRSTRQCLRLPYNQRTSTLITRPAATVTGWVFGLVMLAHANPVAQEHAGPPEAKRVLVLQREGVNNPFRAKFDAAFVEAVRSDDSIPIDLYEETLETDRFPGPEQSQLVRNYLKDKYADRKIDVIVAVGDTALTFARLNREMFGNPPIITVGTLGPIGGADDYVTGLQGRLSFRRTIDL